MDDIIKSRSEWETQKTNEIKPKIRAGGMCLLNCRAQYLFTRKIVSLPVGLGSGSFVPL